MTNEEFAAIRAAAGLSLAACADYLGIEPRSVARYEADRRVPGPVAKLMELLKERTRRK